MPLSILNPLVHSELNSVSVFLFEWNSSYLSSSSDSSLSLSLVIRCHCFPSLNFPSTILAFNLFPNKSSIRSGPKMIRMKARKERKDATTFDYSMAVDTFGSDQTTRRQSGMEEDEGTNKVSIYTKEQLGVHIPHFT